ncbi:MAG: RNA polymerase I associated factor, A49-like protein [Olpidium bornovanus]|uniref:RNA polymerase I associated factor, A49-like protein n=1 Tax=Olpidium bornovanus TaxID=278681 RepID=A0A8H8DLF2_9FUNG|nr:MAG: RNA polymerase I associated factor, A49-like protein [Olpidium bornovanus]
MEATSKEQMISCLPFQTSSFVNDRMQQAAAAKDVNRLRELVYLAILMRFRTVRGKDVNADILNKLLWNPPPAIISGLLRRFTETVVDGKQQIHKITPRSKDKATNYALALALRIDDYNVDPAPLAADMEIGPIKIIEHLRSLGCRIEAVGRSASEAIGVSPAEAKAKRMRRAALTVPLSFPEPRKNRKT